MTHFFKKVGQSRIFKIFTIFCRSSSRTRSLIITIDRSTIIADSRWADQWIRQDPQQLTCSARQTRLETVSPRQLLLPPWQQQQLTLIPAALSGQEAVRISSNSFCLNRLLRFTVTTAAITSFSNLNPWTGKSSNLVGGSVAPLTTRLTQHWTIGSAGPKRHILCLCVN